MNKLIKLSLILMIAFTLSACNYQINKLKKEQFRILKENVKLLLGDSYHVTKIKTINEGYTNREKTEYKVEYTFDLNESLLIFGNKDIPGTMYFEKIGGEWICTLNTGDPSELLDFF